MALPASGPLSLGDIQTEFGGTNPISISEYYAGGAFVASGTSGTYGAVPSSGAISIQNFYGTTAFVPYGEAVYTTAGTYSFVVPAGITKINAVAVGGAGSVRGRAAATGGGGGALSYSNDVPVTPGESLTVVVGIGSTVASVNGGSSSISRSGTNLLLAAGSPFINTAVGSGEPGLAINGVGAVRYNGGGGALYLTGKPAGWRGGAGGAAGYSGDGGKGGYNITGGGGAQPGAGIGGGGGGGGIGFGTIGAAGFGRAGGGVGINGQGANGAAGVVITSGNGAGTNGGGGSGGTTSINLNGGIYGGGAGFDADSNVDVEFGGGGAVRIIWGSGKSYPFNAT
jgi:hypothetical protein